MMSKKEKNKGFLFLLFLTAFGFFSYKISERYTGDIFSNENIVEKEQPQECATCNRGNVEENVTVGDNYEVIYVPIEESVDITDQLGGSVRGAASCSHLSPSLELDSLRRLCAGNPATVNPSGTGVDFSSGVEIEFVTVTYPLAFWLGQHVYRSSIKAITRLSPEYASNGDQIDINYQAKTLSPKQSEEFVEKIEEKRTTRTPFKVFGGLSIKDEREDSEFIVSNADHNPKSVEPEIFTTSDYNVAKPNYIASDEEFGGFTRQQIPQGDNYERLDHDMCLEKGSDYQMLTVGNIPACIDVTGFIKSFISSIFTRSKWEECTLGTVCYPDPERGGVETCVAPSGDCVSTENIAIEMTPIFGDPYECTDELCANAFLTYSYRGSLSPNQASRKQISADSPDDSYMFYIGTPCKIRITINGGGTRIVDSTCLWDASPTLLNYRLEAKDKAPLQEDFPRTFQEYWASVKEVIGKASIFYGLQ